MRDTWTGWEMHARSEREQALVEKIRELPPERVAEIEDFVDFIRQRDEDRRLVEGTLLQSEDAFRAVWDNPEDDVYNRL